MAKKTHDDSLMAQVLAGTIDRRDFMRRAGTLAGAPMLMKGAAVGGAAALAVPAARVFAQDSEGLLTCNNEQQATWIRNFNPLMPENSTSRWPTQFGIYEPLFIWNTVQGTTTPWLAREWNFSEDNLTLTVSLQEGVTWSDGTPFTANDVALPGTCSRRTNPCPVTVPAPRCRGWPRSRPATT